MNAKKTTKSVFFPALSLLIPAALLLVHCTAAGGKKPKQTELLVSILRESGLEEDDFAPLIEEYVKVRPKMLVNTEVRSFEELANPPPDPANERAAGDILIFDGRYLQDLIKGEALLSLEDYHRSDSPLERWALPLNTSIDLLFYNIRLLKEAGFDRPPGTRADYLRYARALKDRGGEAGVYGGALGLSPDDSRGLYRDILPWIWAAGIPLTRDGALDFNGRALNGTLDFLAALEGEGLLAPGSFERTGEQRIGEFAEGKIGMMIGSVRDIPRLREEMGDDSFGITRIPEPEDSPAKPAFGLWVWYGALSRQSARQEEAGDFLLFLRENGPTLTGQLNTLPGHAETASAGWEDPFYAKIWDMYEGADLVRELLGFPGEAVFEEALRRELELMFRENRGAAETALAVQRDWDQWKP